MLGQILGGLALLALGITLFLSREWIYEGALDSQRWSNRRLGAPDGSERFYRPFTIIVVAILSLGACFAGIEVLYEALTGRDFPLHYARWSDLWPF